MRVMLLSCRSGGDDLSYRRSQQMGVRRPTRGSESEHWCTRIAGGQRRLRHRFLPRRRPIILSSRKMSNTRERQMNMCYNT